MAPCLKTPSLALILHPIIGLVAIELVTRDVLRGSSHVHDVGARSKKSALHRGIHKRRLPLASGVIGFFDGLSVCLQCFEAIQFYSSCTVTPL